MNLSTCTRYNIGKKKKKKSTIQVDLDYICIVNELFVTNAN